MDVLAVNPDVSARTVRVGNRPSGFPMPACPAKAASATIAARRDATRRHAAGCDCRAKRSRPSRSTDQMRTLWEQHIWWTRELMITNPRRAFPDEAEVDQTAF